MRARLVFVAIVMACWFAAPLSAQKLPSPACASLQNSFKTVSRPIPTRAELGKALNAAALTSPGLGLSRKTTGNHCPSPVGDVACDILMREDGTYWDAIVSNDGPGARVECGSAAADKITNNDRRWLAPVAVAEPPHVPPPPPPLPPCVFAVSPVESARMLPSAGWTGAYQVETAAQCEWVAAVSERWLHLSVSNPQHGASVVTVTADENTGPARSAEWNIAGQRVTATQDACPQPPNPKRRTWWQILLSIISMGIAGRPPA